MVTGDGGGDTDPPDRDGDRPRAPLRTDGGVDRGEDGTADAFAELRDRPGTTDPDAILEGSPESLVEDADEPADRDDDLLDEDALEELLLPDRAEGDGFRWVETPGSSDDSVDETDDHGDGRGAVDDGVDRTDDRTPAERDGHEADPDERDGRVDDSDERDGASDEREVDFGGLGASSDGNEGDSDGLEADPAGSEGDRSRRDDAESADADDSGGVLSRVRSILGRK